MRHCRDLFNCIVLSDDKMEDELIDSRFLFWVNSKRHLLYGFVYTSMLRNVKSI